MSKLDGIHMVRIFILYFEPIKAALNELGDEEMLDGNA